MSVRGKIVTAAAALTVVAGIGAAGTLTANAATKDCGQVCANFFNTAFGTFSHPSFVLDVQGQAVGQPVTLARASAANTGEDFGVTSQGPVDDFVAAGLLARGLDPAYGKLQAVEIEYGPKGAPTGLCLGVGASSSSSLTPVALRPCGVNSSTIWILDPVTTNTGSYNVLISGATNRNFQHPESLTAPEPNLQLSVGALASLSTAHLTHQLWGFTQGVLPTS
jgi:hypothetical protein